MHDWGKNASLSLGKGEKTRLLKRAFAYLVYREPFQVANQLLQGMSVRTLWLDVLVGNLQ